MLQNSGTTPGWSNLKGRFSPWGQVPTLCAAFLFPPTDGQNTLCCSLSLLTNWTVVPCCTTRMCGAKARFFWPMVASCVGGGNVLPGMASTYTTDCPGDTFPAIVPAKLALAADAISSSVNKQLRVMSIPSPG